MKINKKYIYIIIILNILVAAKISKNDYSQSFKQARTLEKNALFDEAEMIYNAILEEDPGNKTAFNKIKIILKNKNDFQTLEEIAEKYGQKHPNNHMVKIDLVEVYLWSENAKWEDIANELLNGSNIKKDFIAKILLNKILESDKLNYAKKIITLKRDHYGKQDFYSYEMGNYYISRFEYENCIKEYLIYLENNPNQYDKIASKIIAIPEYEDLQNNIKQLLQDSSLQTSKMLLSDLAFKMNDFKESYTLLKQASPTSKQLLDFAYQNKKINNYDLAIQVYNDIIKNNNQANTTTKAILNLGDTLEKQALETKINLPISRYFNNNKILASPYHHLNQENMEILGNAITLYDSLYTLKRGSEAGYKLAGIKFSILNDLETASRIYNQCIKYSKKENVRFKSSLQNINIMIINGQLDNALNLTETYLEQYDKEEQQHLLRIKELQINFYLGNSSLTDNMSQLLIDIKRDNDFYNDLLDLNGMILVFKDNQELLKEFSEVQLMIFQNRINPAINRLNSMIEENSNDEIVSDFLKLQQSYLFLIKQNSDNALELISSISHQTIFSEFAYILEAEIFDFILNDKQNAANTYINFLDKYPLSIYYDDIRLRLRELAN